MIWTNLELYMLESETDKNKMSLEDDEPNAK